MTRVKRAVNAHKNAGAPSRPLPATEVNARACIRKAKEQLLDFATDSYRDRKARKGDFRQLWITRINAAARANDITYNRLVQGLRLAGVTVDRKMLARLGGHRRSGLRRAGRGGAGGCRRGRHRRRGGPVSGRLTYHAGVGDPARRLERPARSGSSAHSAPPPAATTGRFLAEGPQAVRRGAPRVLASWSRCSPTAEALSRCASLVEAATVPVEQISGKRPLRCPRPCAGRASSVAAASMRCLPTRSSAALGSCAVAGQAQRPRQPGTILRTADAAGADAGAVRAGVATSPTTARPFERGRQPLQPRFVVDPDVEPICWLRRDRPGRWSSPRPAGILPTSRLVPPPSRRSGRSASRRAAGRRTWSRRRMSVSGCRSTAVPRASTCRPRLPGVSLRVGPGRTPVATGGMTRQRPCAEGCRGSRGSISPAPGTSSTGVRQNLAFRISREKSALVAESSATVCSMSLHIREIS